MTVAKRAAAEYEYESRRLGRGALLGRRLLLGLLGRRLLRLRGRIVVGVAVVVVAQWALSGVRALRAARGHPCGFQGSAAVAGNCAEQIVRAVRARAMRRMWKERRWMRRRCEARACYED